MKAYLAAPIFTTHQLAIVEGIKALLEDMRYEVFSPYHASREIWKGRAPKDCSQEERDAVLRGNVVNLCRPTNLLVAWVGGTEDGRVDTGVAWEMGFFHNRVLRREYFYEPDKPVPPKTLAYIDPSDKRQHMNLMLAGTVDAVVRGGTYLHRALYLHSQGRVTEMEDLFHPDRLIAHEKEPVV